MLLKEMVVKRKGVSAYIVFRDVEENTVSVLKTERASALALSNNLGVYNAVDSDNIVTIDESKVIGENKAALRTAFNAVHYETPIDASWLSLGVPCLTAVCLLLDKHTNIPYVWCNVFISAKSARATANFFTTAAQVLSEEFEGTTAVSQMEQFCVTSDNMYAYCDCVMISVDALLYLMSPEGKKAFEMHGGLHFDSFMFNYEHLSLFDYKAAKRQSERPRDFEECLDVLSQATIQNNAQVVRKIRNARVKARL